MIVEVENDGASAFLPDAIKVRRRTGCYHRSLLLGMADVVVRCGCAVGQILEQYLTPKSSTATDIGVVDNAVSSLARVVRPGGRRAGRGWKSVAAMCRDVGVV